MVSLTGEECPLLGKVMKYTDVTMKRDRDKWRLIEHRVQGGASLT